MQKCKWRRKRNEGFPCIWRIKLVLHLYTGSGLNLFYLVKICMVFSGEGKRNNIEQNAITNRVSYRF